ncbi:thiol-disulfide isomerase/thioredoxin [Paenibacillus sp. DS2015]|uniref:thioredoxin family protein n=1 Tax=Paenibacillus sp. DS2015 TaxID=3373917 RepID=UPI003D1E59A7
MKDLNQQELIIELSNTISPLAVFFYTPLCGTCKVARRMLEVAEQLLPPGIIMSADVNMMPQLVQLYQITSVPALLVTDASKLNPPIIRYRMGSVEELLNEIRSVVE